MRLTVPVHSQTATDDSTSECLHVATTAGLPRTGLTGNRLEQTLQPDAGGLTMVTLSLRALKSCSILATMAVAVALMIPLHGASGERIDYVWCAMTSRTPAEGNALVFSSEPTSAAAGSCDGWTLDNEYADVDVYTDCTQQSFRFTGTCYSSDSDLSGAYVVSEVDGSCFKIVPCP